MQSYDNAPDTLREMLPNKNKMADAMGDCYL
jgi:hypothetical protein